MTAQPLTDAELTAIVARAEAWQQWSAPVPNQATIDVRRLAAELRRAREALRIAEPYLWVARNKAEAAHGDRTGAAHRDWGVVRAALAPTQPTEESNG